MLKVFLFVIFLILTILSGIWLYDHPGTLEVTWLNYYIQLPVSYFILLLATFFVFALLGLKLVKMLMSIPSRLKKRYRLYSLKKADDALLIALTADQARDFKLLGEEADILIKAEEKQRVATYFKASVLEAEGKGGEASDLYYQLTKAPFGEFLGYYGLFRLSKAEKLYESALEKLLQAFDFIALTPFLLREVLTLMPHLKKLEKIRLLLAKIEQQPKRVLLAQETLLADLYAHAARLAEKEQASALAAAYAERAYAYNPLYATLQAYQLLKASKTRKALKVVENGWEREPSETLATLYIEAQEAKSSLEQVQAVQRLHQSNPTHSISRKILCRYALKAELWGLAREILEDLAKANADLPFVYKCLGEIELKENQNKEKALLWWRKALEFIEGTPEEVC